MIKGTSYAGPDTKGASLIDNNPKPKITLRYHPILSDKQKKLKELGEMIKGREASKKYNKKMGGLLLVSWFSPLILIAAVNFFVLWI
jgi:hypothetical protein